MIESRVIQTIGHIENKDVKLLLVESKGQLCNDNSDYELTYEILLGSPSLKHRPVLAHYIDHTKARDRLEEIADDLFGGG